MSNSKSLLFFSVALLLISPITTSAEAARGGQVVTTTDDNTPSVTNAVGLAYTFMPVSSTRCSIVGDVRIVVEDGDR